MATPSSGSFGYRIDSDRQGKAQIDGLRETQKALKALGESTKKELKSTHLEAAQIVVNGALRIAPVRTGALAASMRAAATMTSGKVRIGNASVPYAGVIHFGWPLRRIKPQPFIYDSLDGRRNAVAQLYAERLETLSRRYGFAMPANTRYLRA